MLGSKSPGFFLSSIFLLLDTCCKVGGSTPANFCLQVHERHAACDFLVLGVNSANEDQVSK